MAELIKTISHRGSDVPTETRLDLEAPGQVIVTPNHLGGVSSFDAGHVKAVILNSVEAGEEYPGAFEFRFSAEETKVLRSIMARIKSDPQSQIRQVTDGIRRALLATGLQTYAQDQCRKNTPETPGCRQFCISSGSSSLTMMDGERKPGYKISRSSRDAFRNARFPDDPEHGGEAVDPDFD